ncbi:MAG: hypothetical protein GWP91_04060, partial [Rhodobacterales bacterium]|nr:hypothetical protein [Rhodobacterales bacterium]
MLPPLQPIASTSNRLGFVGVLSGAVFTVVAMGILAFAVQKPDQLGKNSRVYEATVPVTQDTTARVDLARVHKKLWANWVAARPVNAVADREALRDALVQDPNLVDLFDRMMRAVDEGVTQHTDELLYLVWAWNDYLDDQDQPWRLSAGVQLRGAESAVFYVKAYEVIHDSQTWVGPHATRTRVVRRVDDLNVVEGYLGLTSDHEQGAVVVADRVSELALDRIWPLLDPELDPKRSALDTAFAPSIRDALEANLSAEVWTELSETSADRFWLLAVVDAIHSRGACGSTFRVSAMPFRGLAE